MGWGLRAAQSAVDGDIVVVVDVLRFTTTVAAAVSRGAQIYPCSWDDDPAAIAEGLNAEAAVRDRQESPATRFTLSPISYDSATGSDRVVLASPNGAACSRIAGGSAYVIASALVNVSAVARAVNRLLKDPDRSVMVVACGELGTSAAEDPLRFAVEDYLGAGAVLSEIECSKSPEAEICEGAYLHACPRLPKLLWECASGRELRETGRSRDVEFASRLNVVDVIPVLNDGFFRAL